MTDAAVRTRKKLIEVALPLEAINVASAREKTIRHGHPSNLHRWWARRPLAAARAVIFAQMVDDPSEYVDVLRDDPKLRWRAGATLKAKEKVWEEAKAVAEKAEGTGLRVPEPGQAPTLDDILADQERRRLFRIIEELVLWENTTNDRVLQAARDEIWASWRRTCLDNVADPRAKELFNRHVLPAFHDPFAGGGALPLEAQRLGLESYASDLNPVAVLINKAMIEFPPKFAGRPPVNPASRADRTLLKQEWRGTKGLTEDVRYFGKWIRDEAERRIGYLYPKVEVTAEMVRNRPDLRPYEGQSLTVLAWLWARTVRSPNPAFAHVDVPLVSTFMLSTKAGKEAYVLPVIHDGGYRFTVKAGKPEDPEAAKKGTSAGRWNAFHCLMSGVPVTYDYVREQGVAGHIGTRLMAVVAEGNRGRVYLSPTDEVAEVANKAAPWWGPDLEINYHPRDIKTQIYGLTRYRDLFTNRQLVALTTFADLIEEVRERVRRDALAAGVLDDGAPLHEGGTGATGYADAVAVYLALIISKTTDSDNALCPWEPVAQCTRQLFGRQAIPMVWDFGEANPLHDSSGGLLTNIDVSLRALQSMAMSSAIGLVEQADASSQLISQDKVISTDPPYYDNIGYADLSDFFYVWLRRSLKPVLPALFATMAVPKGEELVATPYRHGTKEKAEDFFLHGMTRAMHRLAVQTHPGFPVTIYYAFKQAESRGSEGTASTGWETFLQAVIRAGLAVTGTWPIRSEMTAALKSQMNSLASSIVLVCRPRSDSAPTATRREFVAALRSELPAALANLQRGNIAPVDLAQASIGPGMAVYTRYSMVLDAQGQPLTVREALSLINATLEEALAEQEGDFDADSRWALAWFDQFGFGTGPYGVAETLSTAKNTSVGGMAQAGILASKGGDVRLLTPAELDPSWDPASDARRPAWQTVHQLILASNQGEEALAKLISKLGPEADIARELAYRLYVLSERKKRAEEGGWYNGLVQSWNEAVRIGARATAQLSVQGELFGEG